ncbi:hypothetical protein Rhe02_39830 [Rhizocola hellebori]|uniref:Uncharacterized protein n=1 Tax=Rhizocola hellebori TaxID=1392758 RepID=A0A8J3QA50_9ACTN|nr:hypothetical protein [Rhizocola hellebori]GIH05916.1 hypothetical protein Rhe02_39830 [Rhizocola hellebori]
MPEDYDELIHGAFGDFTDDAESTITSRGSGDVRSKVARRRRYRTTTVIVIILLLALVGFLAFG